jgi:hypothetical protein
MRALVDLLYLVCATAHADGARRTYSYVVSEHCMAGSFGALPCGASQRTTSSSCNQPRVNTGRQSADCTGAA